MASSPPSPPLEPPSARAVRQLPLIAAAAGWLTSGWGILLLASAAVIYGGVVTTGRMGDYDVYLRAAHRLVAGESVYRLEDSHRYLYAPLFPFVFVPFLFVPVLVGKIVWYGLNLCLAMAILRRSARFAFGAERVPPGFVLLLAIFALRFLDNNIAHGQMNLVLLWLVLEAYAAASGGRFAVAGLALAAAITTKLFPVILLVQLALRRQWRFWITTLAGGVLLLLAPALWWGGRYPAVLSGWMAVVIDQATHYDLGNKINQSISAFAYRLFGPDPGGGAALVVLPPACVSTIVGAVHAAFLLPLAMLSARLARTGARDPAGPEATELSLYLLYATVLLPYSWKYYFVNLIPALAIALRRLWLPHPRWLAWGLCTFLALNWLPGQGIFGKRVGLLFQLYSFHFAGVVVLFVLVLAGDRTWRGSGFTSRERLC